MFIQGIRGATTVELDDIDEVKSKTKILLKEMIDKNVLLSSQIIYILFTATSDIKSVYPAVAAREMGFTDIPLICCQEMEVIGSLDKCIRILMLVQRPQKHDVFHIYQERAVVLRPDIIEKEEVVKLT